MADEIYINIGSTFQQPYQGQRPANAQEPNVRDIQQPNIRDAQQPYPFAYRNPFIYGNPVSAQQPNIRNARQPFTYNRTGQTPFTYQHQSPFTYRNPVSAQENNPKNAQQPYPYIANGRQPSNAQQPYPYQATGQQPNIRNRQSPYTYNYRSPNTYIYNKPVQSPYIGSRQTQIQGPYIYQARNPIVEGSDVYRVPTPANKQGPHTGPQTYSLQANAVASRSPFTTTQVTRTPVIYQTGQLFGLITVNYPMYQIQTEQEYRYSLQNVSRQAAQATTTNLQQPVITYNNIGDARQPYPANIQQPNIRDIQEPHEYDHRSPFTYERQGRSPFTYRHPFTYARQGRSPFTYQIQSPFTYQNPVSGQEPNIRGAQQPYPYIAAGQTPFTYDHRSPFTYQNNVNAQQPLTTQGQTPFTYNYRSPFTYDHRSPHIVQQNYATTREIGPHAKVKGVFVNNAGSVSKVDEVYVNAPQGPQPSNVEKIHQSVPNAQFLKGN